MWRSLANLYGCFLSVFYNDLKSKIAEITYFAGKIEHVVVKFKKET